MSRHYGRTTLLHLYGGLFLLLALLALCTSGAEADDTRPYMNCHGHWIPVDECDDTNTKAIYPIQTLPGSDGFIEWPYYGVAPSTDKEVRGDEVAALLERCLEYVRDGDRNYLEGSMYDTLLYVEPYQTLKDDARDKLNALDRETKLRRDIEALLLKLRKGE